MVGHRFFILFGRHVFFFPFLPVGVRSVYFIFCVKNPLLGVIIQCAPVGKVAEPLLTQLVELVAVLGSCQLDRVSPHTAVLVGVDVRQRP